MNRRLYIGNLTYSVTNDELRQEFIRFGALRDAKVIMDGDGRSKGFGFVEFEIAEDAKKAADTLDGQELRGRKLKVNEARERV